MCTGVHQNRPDVNQYSAPRTTSRLPGTAGFATLGGMIVLRAARAPGHGAARQPPARSARPRSALAVLGLAVAALVSSGCVLGGQPCTDDRECGDGYCARNGECSSEIVFVHIRWRVQGQLPTEASCGDDTWIGVTFEDRDIDDHLTYEPIRCPLGQITFDRMPARYDAAVLSVKDRRGDLIEDHRAEIQPPGIMMEVDLLAQAARAD